MTVSAQTAHIEYIATGSLSTLVYPFQIHAQEELEVRYGEEVQVADHAYSVTGVGSTTGGSITLLIAPASGSVVSLRRVVAFEQALVLTPNSILPATSLEGRLDQIVKMVQQLEEELSRRPSLIVGTKGSHRDLVFPPPGRSQAIVWNAEGTELTTASFTQEMIEPEAPADIVFETVSATVSASNGAAVLTSANLIPAGVQVIGVLVDTTTQWGNSNGLTSLSVGDEVIESRWGDGIPLTTGSTSQGNFNDATQPIYTAAQDVVLVAEGGLFDGTGAATITVWYVNPNVDSPPADLSSISYAIATTTLTSSAGAASLTATNLIPASSRVYGVFIEVVLPFGVTGGLTSLAVGDTLVDDRWGRNLGITAGATSVQSDFRTDGLPIYVSATSVIVSAIGGLFDADGSVFITVIYSQVEEA